jgi:RNA recognition motif-containing protein
MKLYVGNLPLSHTESDLENLFVPYNSVISCKLIMDRETKRSKGFGFVEFSSKEEAVKAIEELNGKDVDGRKLVVNEARPQEKKEMGGGMRRPFNNNKRRF